MAVTSFTHWVTAYADHSNKFPDSLGVANIDSDGNSEPVKPIEYRLSKCSETCNLEWVNYDPDNPKRQETYSQRPSESILS